MNYGDIMKSHFSPVFDVFNLFSNVHVDSSTTSSDAGKFYMKIPKAMGGDDQEHCVLDLTVGAVYVNKAREIINMEYGFIFYGICLGIFLLNLMLEVDTYDRLNMWYSRFHWKFIKFIVA
ncbi:hypothetical protein [Clostridium saccharoperbutylacetonicum]|uniref:hypothetical protein n=1 Tax=Clostridium saccharoperbutylacetonicum TaxID=36745 RepID=UPI00156FD0FE|nr:hypothetical protein [Clostridium saccharoperbutylacetonicum]NSB34787.1 hypothetical protein [Clostridium saccharoperbutylacetonicum]